MTLEADIQLRLGTLNLRAQLSAQPGQVLAVLGPNGGGKTTLLRALAGLEPIDSGRVLLDGEMLDDPAKDRLVAPEDRRVGFLFQDYLLFPHLSVLENVAFGLRCRRRDRPRDVAREWLERVGLGDVAEARPSALSGGQAQRVALARALAPGPRLLLLDEPLSALDASTSVAIRRELSRHLEAFEGICLVVTHDRLEAALLADSVLVLEEGRVVQAGGLAEIAAHPRSAYVADLVEANLWRGRAEGGQVLVNGTSIAVSGDRHGEVFAMVRPQAVSLYLERPAGSPRNVWRGPATSLDAVGDRVRVGVAGVVPVVAEVTRQGLAELGIGRGDEVWISFKASEVEVYEV